MTVRRLQGRHARALITAPAQTVFGLRHCDQWQPLEMNTARKQVRFVLPEAPSRTTSRPRLPHTYEHHASRRIAMQRVRRFAKLSYRERANRILDGQLAPDSLQSRHARCFAANVQAVSTFFATVFTNVVYHLFIKHYFV